MPGRDTGVQGRDVGLQAAGAWHHRGDGPFLEYAAGVFRGQTLVYSPPVHDAASASRVLLYPISGLSVGGDWYGSFHAPAHAEKRRYEGEGAYERRQLRLRAEQIWARDGVLERRGGYVLGAWNFSP